MDRLRRHLRASLASGGEWYWAPLLYVAAVCILYYPVLGGHQGFGWDTIETYWPDLSFFSDRLAHGQWPLWNPFDRGGYPFYADPQSSIMYPVQWLLAAVGVAIGGAPWWLIQAKMLGHLALGAALMHLFLRSRGLERPAAIIGSLTLLCCAPWMIHKASNILLPMSWVPLVWLAIDRFLATPRSRQALLLAGALYLPGSAGSPPGFFYALLLAASYGAYRLGCELAARRAEGTARGYASRVASRLAVAGVVTVLLLLIIVVPGFDLTELTARHHRGLAYSLSFPLPPKGTVLGLFVPTAGKLDAYMGMTPLMLMVSAVAARARRDRGIAVAVLVMGAFFLVLAFGGATPVLAWLVEHVPGFGLFRAANRYKLLAAMFFAVASGYGASAVIRSGPGVTTDTLRSAGGVLFILALTTVLAIKLERTEVGMPAPSFNLRVAVGAAVVVLGTAAAPRRWARAIILLAAPLILFDAAHVVQWRGPVMEAKPDHSRDLATLDALPRAGQDLRIYDEYQLEQRVGSRLRVRDFRGYPSGDPLDLQRYLDVLDAIDQRPELLAAFNVGYVLTGRHHRNGTSRNHLRQRPSRTRPKLFAAAGRVDVARMPTPWVAWYNTDLVVSTDASLDAVALQARVPADQRVAILEPADAKALGESRAKLEGKKTVLSGSGEVVDFGSDRILTSVNPPSTALVVLNEVQYPGWTAYVDGHEAPSIRANFLLRATVVGPGPHLVEWRFEPPRYPWLVASWFLAALAVLLAVAGARGQAWVARWRKRSLSR